MLSTFKACISGVALAGTQSAFSGRDAGIAALLNWEEKQPQSSCRSEPDIGL